MNHDHTDHRIAPQAGPDLFDRFAADPFAPTTPAPPVGQPAPAVQPRHRWWMHLLMCAPMLAVVAFLIATGAAGFGAIGYAVACMVMMGAMMLFMNQGPQGGHKH